MSTIIKYNRYILTNHAYMRAKERIDNKVINDIKKIDSFRLEIILNNFIRNTPNIDIETSSINNSILFKIPNTKNFYIVVINDIIITIKKSNPTNLLNTL